MTQPTSAPCRRAERAPAASGFTLLELLVVLAVAALAMGLAAPRLAGWASAAEERAALDGLRTRIEALPAAAFFAGRAQLLAEQAQAWPLPPGWRIASPAPVVYEANGMTAGGEVRVLAGDRQLAHWRVAAPAGTLEGVGGP